MTDLSVYSSIGVRSAAEELFRQFEKQNGSRLAVTWGTAPMLVARIEAGERADILILSRAGMDTLLQQGKVLSGSDVTLAGSGVAIAVKQGAPKPDISTAEALKETLLNAKSIAYSASHQLLLNSELGFAGQQQFSGKTRRAADIW
jgi:molybdate transport system substrate-binding protein